ncbi:hypothetical protein DXG01_017019 [Tephrocybe rancida]|nr:hypothetical protein DXG01_017019 [Tephrocybe rancida]
MSTPMIVMPNDPTIFPHVGEEELAHAALNSPFTDEEFNALLLSVSPHTTEFNPPKDLYQSLTADMTTDHEDFDTQGTFHPYITFPNPSFDISDKSFMDSITALPPDMTPSQFVVGCGYQLSDFMCFNNPASDTDLWHFVMNEFLDKIQMD